jgi:hypothetical protein
MDPYLLSILAKERHEEILKEALKAKAYQKRQPD